MIYRDIKLCNQLFEVRPAREIDTLPDVGGTAPTLTGAGTTADYTGPLGDIVASFEAAESAFDSADDSGLTTTYFETPADEAASSQEDLSPPSPTQGPVSMEQLSWWLEAITYNGIHPIAQRV